MAQGMKRLGTPIAALLGVALIALIATSWLINRDALRKAVEAQIRDVTGLELNVAGSIEISVLPASYISFRDVGLKGGGTSAPALQVDVLTANLRLLPLLLQRFEIADLTLLRPRIHVSLKPDGESNWTPFIQTIARTMKPGAENQVSFSEIRIQDGVLDYEDVATRANEKLEDIDLSLAWPSISRSFAATGQFDWRGERVDGSISFSDFVAALSGDRSGLKARIASAPLKLAFDGSVANRTSAMMEGTLTVDSPSLRNALRWTGQPQPGSGGFGRFVLKARANVVGASIALTNVNVELDGNAAEGVMTYANNGRQTLQATLAADALDFTPYISTFRLLASGARDWNRQLFDLQGLSTTDLDMRLSAAKLTVGPTRLGRTAIGANLRNGTLALSVGEAQVYGGIAKGSFGIARSDTVADIKAQFQFTDVDLQACATELFGLNKLSGRGNINVSLFASGSSPFGLVQSLDGSATVTGHNGAIAGFNAEQLLKRLERRPLSGGGNFRSGSTPYDKLTIAVKFSDGIATAEDIRIEGPAAKITLTGTASVPTREYDMKGVASLNTASGFQLPFMVQGPWDDPLIFPDPESLIRQSPAASPFLDLLKQRITGGKRPEGSPTAENAKEGAKSN
ncbi:AsmA family protein [Bradyrhizobium sp. IC3069]|uniref:AsmA family protein n=1 Tax=unclassified Bradyrhizobium TaxID=2631580 RepID=UPI001CD5FA90|nr:MULTISPECIES: AsmA family protein [unclassified Bradyrhizobium]MCA1361831.1 AsmA family protein [Bradyrhizobium sp. IC4059]MCA1374537.1 AsmA family protein [Bradyrhizobium sp. IC4060]MCA1518976.1 AsmA family protein [Bradyrhizobium sp. IC3069]MCA1535517.1 AsmA family protein [Bradyrhizobium sp. NBAIM03]MCA1540892.1 AsmA family protein [Bradyrhizobium sp. NBAIM32]